MKTFLCVVRRVLAVLLALIFALLGAACLIAIPLSNNYSAMVSMAIAMPTTAKSGGSNPQYFTSDYSSAAAVQEASAQLCREIEQEGMVLLRNNGDALPLAKGASVTLLGESAADLVYGGAGAGSVDTSTAPNLRRAMEAAGFTVNPVLWDFYTTGAGASYKKEVPSITGQGRFAANEAPQSAYTQAEFDSMAQYNDAAIVVIGRSGSESVDLPTEYLSFTQEERNLIQMATERFDKVILLLNVTNPINMTELSRYDIDAVLWVGALGQEGAYAIGEALNGTVNPSGHLVDTWAADAASAPAAANLGDYTITNSDVFAGNKYIVYAEGVYVGYRYYETRYEDAVLAQGNAGDFDYDAQVVYPFGYGLSYTDFSWSDYKMTETADGFALNVTVTNTGKAAGKEVVQAYLQNPYTEYDRANRIEKPAVELVGFAKTDILQPGESQTVKIDVDKSALKVFDAYGAGTYILEAGDYYLTAASNAHEAAKNILAAKGAEVDGNAAMTALYNQAQTDTKAFATAETGAAVTAQMADADITTYDADFTYLSRSDWTGTWPTTYQNGSWEAPETVLTALEITRPEDESAEMPAFDEAGNLKLCDLIGADYDDARWETLLSQMSKKDTYNLIRYAGYGTMAVESIGAPGTVHKDGPAGISSTLAGGNLHCMAYEPAVVLASTYNVELASRRGKLVGEDSLSSGVQVWYAPAMNIHRAANSGRNFEYYAEDPLLSGVFGAAETAAFQSKGGIVTIKHFAFNDQETNRIGGAMFVNEQAARQLYLKPFEMSVVDGGAVGIMSGMNRIGCRWIGGHEGIMTNILRGEWGYKGFVITDQTSFNSFDYCDIREGLAAGNDLWLNTAHNMWALNDSELTATVMQNARTAVHRYLYAVANSNAMNGVDADTTVKNIIPAWQYGYVALVVFVAVMWFFGFKAVRALWASKRYLAKKAERKAKRAAKKAAKAQKAQ